MLVDAIKHKVIKTFSLGKPGVVKPMAVLLSPDAAKLCVSTGRGHQVFIIDTPTNAVAGSVEVGPRSWGIALSPDGKMLYTANGPSNGHFCRRPRDKHRDQKDQSRIESLGHRGAQSLLRPILKITSGSMLHVRL